MRQAPTIARLLTPPGKGGIAVISLRGQRAGEILTSLFRPLRTHSRSGEGRLQLGRLVADGRVLDEAVVQWQGDWAEVNIHGGPAVARGVLEAMLRRGATINPNAPPAAQTGLPTAHPRWNNPSIGEEMLQALLDAASTTVVSAVSLQWSAGISELARAALGELECCHESRPIAMGRLCEPPSRAGMPSLQVQLRQAAEGLSVMRRILEPAEVVLAGPPNAGKSTLANALVGRPISIVHETPGTTRDWVRELAFVNGLPVWITDTAGLWRGMGVSPMRGEGILPVRGAGILPARAEGVPPSDASSSSSSVFSSPGQPVPTVPPSSPESALQSEIDRQSFDRALARIGRADLVLILGQPPAAAPHNLSGRARVLAVWTKADACPPPSTKIGDCPYFCVSAKTGAGMEQLKEAILATLNLEGFDPALPRAFTLRQAELLLSAAEAIERSECPAAIQFLLQLLEV